MRITRSYTEEEKESMHNYILDQIEKGRSLNEITKIDDDVPPKSTYYLWLDKNQAWHDSYYSACEEAMDAIAQEILAIADDGYNDVFYDDKGNQRINHGVIERDKLRVAARQWYLGKRSNKYSNKLDITSKNEKITHQVVMFKLPDNARD